MRPSHLQQLISLLHSDLVAARALAADVLGQPVRVVLQDSLARHLPQVG